MSRLLLLSRGENEEHFLSVLPPCLSRKFMFFIGCCNDDGSLSGRGVCCALHSPNKTFEPCTNTCMCHACYLLPSPLFRTFSTDKKSSGQARRHRNLALDTHVQRKCISWFTTRKSRRYMYARLCSVVYISFARKKPGTEAEIGFPFNFVFSEIHLPTLFCMIRAGTAADKTQPTSCGPLSSVDLPSANGQLSKWKKLAGTIFVFKGTFSSPWFHDWGYQHTPFFLQLYLNR